MSAPQVYTAISAVAGELAQSGVAKNQLNEDDRYHFRGIDDIIGALAPLLVQHRLCILPRVLSRVVTERGGGQGNALFAVTLHMSYTFVSAEDGSTHIVETFGEAIDESDKGTNKAMSAAFKYAMIQSFCIPVKGLHDADAATRRSVVEGTPEPVQGWQQWSVDICDVARSCASAEALDRLQLSNRASLKAIADAQPRFYGDIGIAIRERRAELAAPKDKITNPESHASRQPHPKSPPPGTTSASGEKSQPDERCGKRNPPRSGRVRPPTEKKPGKRKVISLPAGKAAVAVRHHA